MAQDVAGSLSAKLALTSFLGSELIRSAWEKRTFDPDVIHAHWWFPSGVVGMTLSTLTRKPMVTTLHGTDLRLAKKSAAARSMLRSVLRKSAAVSTVSRWLASELSTIAADADVEVAPMPVATEKFAPHGNHHANRFLFAGRLNKQKGLDHLLRAFAAMHGVAMLDVVGEGQDASDLKLLASQLGISDRVVWHGQLKQPDLLKMYQAATAVVVPSIDEGLGLVAAEALLCETPVIAFRSGGLVDVVEHDRTGILVTPGETAELSGALDRVLTEPDRMKDLARAGRGFALDAFSPETAANRYASIYSKALAHRAA
jgi:glycosyltransferase involved in cell wall biosynthesis